MEYKLLAVHYSKQLYLSMGMKKDIPSLGCVMYDPFNVSGIFSSYFFFNISVIFGLLFGKSNDAYIKFKDL